LATLDCNKPPENKKTWFSGTKLSLGPRFRPGCTYTFNTGDLTLAPYQYRIKAFVNVNMVSHDLCLMYFISGGVVFVFMTEIGIEYPDRLYVCKMTAKSRYMNTNKNSYLDFTARKELGTKSRKRRDLVVRAATTPVNKPDVVGSIPVTTEFFLISCDSNQVPKWFGTYYNLEVPL